MSTGLINVCQDRYVLEESDVTTAETTVYNSNSDVSVSKHRNGGDDDESMQDLLEAAAASIESGDIELDAIMASVSGGIDAKGVSPQHLAKTWRIDIETARETIEKNTQHSRCSDKPHLSRNYGTND